MAIGTSRRDAEISICWMKTADAYPDGHWRENSFTAFDPEVRFPRFHMVEGDEPIGGVDLIKGGLQSGLWQWSMTASLPGPRLRQAHQWRRGKPWRSRPARHRGLQALSFDTPGAIPAHGSDAL